MTLPAIPFLQLYAVGVLATFYCSSLATLMSVIVPPSSSLVAAVAAVMILGGQLNGVTPNLRKMAPALRGASALSYNRRGGRGGGGRMHACPRQWASAPQLWRGALLGDPSTLIHSRAAAAAP